MTPSVRYAISLGFRYAGIAIGLILFPAVMLGYLLADRRWMAIAGTAVLGTTPVLAIELMPTLPSYKQELIAVLFFGLALEFAAGALAHYVLWNDTSVRTIGAAGIAGVFLAVATFPVTQVKNEIARDRTAVIAKPGADQNALLSAAFERLVTDTPAVIVATVRQRLIAPSFMALVRSDKPADLLGTAEAEPLLPTE